MMKTMRTVARYAAALTFATLASLGMAAPQKTYSLQAASGATYSNDPVTLQRSVDVPVPVVVTVKNESPPSTANSNISSFTFTVAGLTMTGVDNATCATQGGNCSLDKATNTVSVTKISPPIQGQGTFSVPVTVASCGDGAWSAVVWTGSQLTGNRFSFVNDPKLPTNLATSVSCGDANCGLPFVVHNAIAGSPTSVNGIRGTYNKDGGTCSAAPFDYFVTNTIPTNDTLHFEWDTATFASFLYTVSYPSAVNPSLSWLSDNVGPVFIDGQNCLATQMPNNLPAPYGTLSQALTKNANKIQINVTTAPTIATPFPIVIGTERMLVTAIRSNNWTVQRGQGGTSAAAHGLPASVMSTPLPLLAGPFTQQQTSAGYSAGNQAHMCVQSPDAGSWPAAAFTIIDIGDGWILGR